MSEIKKKTFALAIKKYQINYNSCGKAVELAESDYWTFSEE
jgi:hypothetical protein